MAAVGSAPHLQSKNHEIWPVTPSFIKAPAGYSPQRSRFAGHMMGLTFNQHLLSMEIDHLSALKHNTAGGVNPWRFAKGCLHSFWVEIHRKVSISPVLYRQPLLYDIRPTFGEQKSWAVQSRIIGGAYTVPVSSHIIWTVDVGGHDFHLVGFRQGRCWRPAIGADFNVTDQIRTRATSKSYFAR